jgi:neutral amino acid transport system substrate-binding protein
MRFCSRTMLQLLKHPKRLVAFALLAVFLGACESQTERNGNHGLKIGSLLPATGDAAPVGAPMIPAVPLLVKTINGCGGVNGKPVELVSEDDQSDQIAGNTAMNKLILDKVAGVVGSFPSGISNVAGEIAKRNKVMLISPGSTSPVLTDRAKKGDFKNGELSYWARTAPPDIYQARALAKLAQQKGLKKVSTLVINNDYGVAFEKEFVLAFKNLGGTVVNEKNPVRYDPKAASYDSETRAAFSEKPDGVAAIVYPETGGLVLKSAYQQGLTQGVQILLTDGAKSDAFAGQVGKTKDGKFIIEGTVGTVPGADGKALEAFTKLWQAEKKTSPPAFVPQTWDAAALLALAAESAKANTGEGIASKIREVANAPGEEVTDVCKGLELLKAGKDINYQGASGNVDIDEAGDVIGVYDIWQVQSDGKLKITGKIQPK